MENVRIDVSEAGSRLKISRQAIRRAIEEKKNIDELIPDDVDWTKLLTEVDPEYARVRKQIMETVQKAGAIGAEIDDLHWTEVDVYKTAGFRLGLAAGMKLAGKRPRKEKRHGAAL